MLKLKIQNSKPEMCLLLDNIRSVHNVGSIFRTAETAGISKIYCLGTTPTPLDRFKRKRQDFAKVALGAEELVAWEYVKSGVILVKILKREGFKIIALEQAENSIDYRKVKATGKILIILGNEVGGVSKGLLNLSDEIAEIPMRGKKESLNVSVAVGIMMYEMLLD